MANTNTLNPKPQTQKQRWMKYGANVAAVSLIVVVLAVLVIWLGQITNRRLDLTRSRLYSLKPQTLNVIQNNSVPIKIISLYTRAKPQQLDSDEIEEEDAAPVDRVQPVADLLEEYKRKGKNIDIETIDPVEQPTKVDQLIEEVTWKYGGEVKKYKAVMDDYPAIYDQLSKLAASESDKVRALPLKQITSQDLAVTVVVTIATVQNLPKYLDDTQKAVDKALKQRPPDYKGAVETLDRDMAELLLNLGKIIEDFGRYKEDAKVPQPIRAYMAESLPRYEQLKKLAQDLTKRISELGKLKLDDLKQSLKAKNTILVMGPDDMRVLPFDRVWERPDELRFFSPDGKVKRRFAGERQVTSALLALTNKGKSRVVFVRPGSAPLTNPGIPGFQAPGYLAAVAERLREYNFEVLEKDLSGMFAMQSQMQGLPTPPEPTDEEMKNAVWIVLDIPAGRSPMGPPPAIAPKLAAHLKAGGSALVLALPQADDLAAALNDWGVKIRPDILAVHEPIKSQNTQVADVIEDVQRHPYIFVVNDYGDHPLAKPLKSLDGLILPMLVVETSPKPGYKTTPLLPVPQALKIWGESDLESALSEKPIEYNPPTGADKFGDLPAPLYAGAVVEKEDGAGRLVVIGSLQFASNQLVNFPDLRLQRPVARFPGNSELFCNSVLWLSKMEPMLAISSTAMEVSRIRDMTPATLQFWRVGVLLIALPSLVIIAGIVTYFARRD
ncbi:MAG TPA: Gldg family protein [Tepidisphaeraceae bacterium]|nr:Gldg family protein [Tepidisphaeraceae bacterium]